MPRYTLIIPHHNIPTLLDRLLQTVPRRDDMQVIVVDDCSTEQIDQLEEVKNKYPRIEWYSTDTNGGGGKARNVGLEHAIGDYLIFADADDYFLPAFGNLLNEYKDKEFDILYFSCYDRHLGKRKRSYVSKVLDSSLKGGDMSDIKFRLMQPWCKIINRRVVEDYGIRFQESVVCNDVIFSTYVDYYAKNIQISQVEAYVHDIREKSTYLPRTRLKRIIEIDILLKRYEIIRQHRVEHVDLVIMHEILSYVYHCRFRGVKELISVVRKYKIKNSDLIRMLVIYIISKMILYHKWGWKSRNRLKKLLSVNKPI